eukprot:2079152-Rhodomonas_salina.2
MSIRPSLNFPTYSSTSTCTHPAPLSNVPTRRQRTASRSNNVARGPERTVSLLSDCTVATRRAFSRRLCSGPWCDPRKTRRFSTAQRLGDSGTAVVGASRTRVGDRGRLRA